MINLAEMAREKEEEEDNNGDDVPSTILEDAVSADADACPLVEVTDETVDDQKVRRIPVVPGKPGTVAPPSAAASPANEQKQHQPSESTPTTAQNGSDSASTKGGGGLSSATSSSGNSSSSSSVVMDGGASPNSVISNDGRIGQTTATTTTPTPPPPSGVPAPPVLTAPPTTESKKNTNKKQQTPPSTTTTATTYGQYPGFSPDYSEYMHRDYTSYASVGHTNHAAINSNSNNTTLTDMNSTTTPNVFQNLITCIFPWTQQQSNDADDDYDDVYGTNNNNMRSNDADDISSTGSTSTTSLGQKLSDRERQAVLARLRLVQSTTTATPATTAAAVAAMDTSKNDDDDDDDASWEGSQSTAHTSNHDKFNLSNNNGLSNDEEEDGNNKNGVDENNSNSQSTSPASTTNTNSNNNSPKSTNLRGILRKSSTIKDSVNGNKGGDSSVSGGGGGGTTKKRRSLFPQYDATPKISKNMNVSFSPMARVVSVKSKNDMTNDEKGDIWWQKSDYEEFRKTGRMITRAMLQGGSEIWLASNRSWQMPNGSKASTLQHALSLSEKSKLFHRGDLNAKAEYESARDKWWHKFGHSRRGLEHIASIDEGRQRQANVRAAIRAVVQEQRRQKVFQREDADKLRMVSIQYTSWARDLAIASGHSDADAVNSKFNDENRKTREFYLLKFARQQQQQKQTTRTNTNNSNMPEFMKPILLIRPDHFDMNTSTQIQYRKNQQQQQMKKQASQNDTMAKRAAGYASGKEIGNMSSVLTGMGPETATVGGP